MWLVCSRSTLCRLRARKRVILGASRTRTSFVACTSRSIDGEIRDTASKSRVPSARAIKEESGVRAGIHSPEKREMRVPGPLSSDAGVIQRELVLDPSHGHCERTRYVNVTQR